ncbi:hypothetical protein P261_02130 [Lachnospiraceae bacterium TWA4]|nr:hypothetical protein P261_02130 [Lachnospiraceae bacterium TWA4]
MKRRILWDIEKINDHQIRCTLNSRDLASRELNIAELAYGSEKARSLFQEMIEKASMEFGFETEDMPLMIEAVPLPAESLMLIITKVEDPEELDTRFSKFSSFDESLEDTTKKNRADDIVDLFRSIFEKSESSLSNEQPSDKDPTSMNVLRIYSFKNLDTVIEVSKILRRNYSGINSLYKNEQTGMFYLIVNKSHHTPEEFNKTCNILSEYGEKLNYDAPSYEAYLAEHYTCLVKDSALQRVCLF